MFARYPLGIGSESLVVHHPQFTYGDLVDLSDEGRVIERSDHIGNLHAGALLTVTDPNVNTRQLLVNTSNGDDTEYWPRHIELKDRRIPLATKSQGTVIVGRLAVNAPDKVVYKASTDLESLGLDPIQTDDYLADIHLSALRKVSENSQIYTKRNMTKEIPTAVRSMMKFMARNGGVTRVVGDDGRIRHHEGPINEALLDSLGIYGVEDEEGIIFKGALIPLPVSLAMDIVYNASLENENLYHQAGSDMRRYTHDPELMSLVAQLAGVGLRKIGGDTVPQYSVIDTGNIGHIANEIELPARAKHEVNSQYDALALKNDFDFTFAPNSSQYDAQLWLDN